jgi:hypothetical protein
MVLRVAAKRFTVILERVQKTGTMFRMPFDLTETFARVRPTVKLTITATVADAREGRPQR